MTLITVSFIDVKLLLSENTAQTTHQRVIIVILGLRQSLNQFFLLAGLIDKKSSDSLGRMLFL